MCSYQITGFSQNNNGNPLVDEERMYGPKEDEMSQLRNSIEHLLDNYLFQNDFNIMIIGNIFSPETAPTFFGYKTMESNEIKRAIINADQSQISIFYINPANNRLLEKDPIRIPYDTVKSIKKQRSSYGLRNKVTIVYDDQVIVLDYGDAFIGYQEFSENKVKFHNLLKKRFLSKNS